MCPSLQNSQLSASGREACATRQALGHCNNESFLPIIQSAKTSRWSALLGFQLPGVTTQQHCPQEEKWIWLQWNSKDPGVSWSNSCLIRGCILAGRATGTRVCQLTPFKMVSHKPVSGTEKRGQLAWCLKYLLALSTCMGTRFWVWGGSSSIAAGGRVGHKPQVLPRGVEGWNSAGGTSPSHPLSLFLCPAS